ncbi:MAG: MFS transporter [Proteobacteria bacterium]|nr:MFS transporter [Pseudomonadota bacterium]
MRLAPAVERNYRYVVLAASTLIFMVAAGSTLILVVNLKPIAEEFLWPRTVPSLAYSLQYMGSGIGGLLMGWWVDRAGMGRPALLGAVMIGTGAVLVAHVASQWQLYAVYGVMMGFLGLATMYSPLMANTVRWFERGRGMAVGIVSSGQSLAGAMWPPVFRYASETIGWRATFFWYGVFALASMIPLALLLRRRPPEPGAFAAAPPGATLAEASVPAPAPDGLGLAPGQLQAGLSVAIVGCCVAMAMPTAHLVAYATDLGHPSARAAEMLSVLLAVSFFARALGVGLLVDRLGGLRALFAFSAAQAAALAMMAASDGLVALYLAAAAFGIGYGGVIPCYPVIVREFLPVREAGRRTAAVILFGAAGMALGGWMGGAIYDLAGTYRPAFVTGVAFNLANLALVAALIARSRRPRARALAG